MILNSSSGRTVLNAIILFSIILSSVSAFGQRSRAVAANKSAAVSKCSGAWTGTVNYSRTQTTVNNKRVERVSGRGYDTTNFELNYNYAAQVLVIESPQGNGQSIGRATIDHRLRSSEKVEGVELNSCDRGKSFKEMRGTSTSVTETTGEAGGVEANINVGVNSDGTYSVSVGLPQIEGKVSGSQSSTFSGQCTPKEGKSFNMPATPTTLDGHSLTSDGTTRINDSEPNRISGSYSLKLPGDVTETISWNLQKCGAPLRIVDVKFEDMKFPNWDDWKEVTEQVGTIDGNLVKVRAKVLNTSGEEHQGIVYFKETYKGDKWDGARPDYPLKDHGVDVRVGPGEEQWVDILWDTSGFAWFDDGRPRLVQRVKAEVWEKNKRSDELTKNIKVAPKPLVLVHGAWSHWKEYETWQNILTTTHSYDWKAFPVGEVTNKGIINTGRDFLSSEETNSTPQNAGALRSYIQYAQEDRNAWHVDIVAHGIGGLISRYYIQSLMPPNYADGRPQIAHLLMLGTPNLGSPCADVMDLAFSLTGKSPRVVHEMTQDAVAGFNRTVNSNRGVKFSALAGDPLPTMCKSIVANDGFVSVPSAQYGAGDTATSGSIHPDLVSTKDFSDFVKPRLAIGPRGDHNPAMPSIPRGGLINSPIANEVFAGRTYGMSLAPAVFDAYELLSDTPFAKRQTIGPKQTVEISIPVTAAQDVGVTFMSSPSISATLVDDKGIVVGTNLADSPEGRGWFRSIFYDKPVTAGTWKLHVQNTGDAQGEIVVTTWTASRG
jgi:hypothetical protein